jgi:hypothetical protein
LEAGAKTQTETRGSTRVSPLSDLKQNYSHYVSQSDRIFRQYLLKSYWQKKLQLGIGGTIQKSNYLKWL